MKIILIMIALAAILAIAVPTIAISATSNSNSTTTATKKTTDPKSKTPDSSKSNYVKRCLKLTDKKTRSIVCPGIFPKSETSIGLYG